MYAYRYFYWDSIVFLSISVSSCFTAEPLYSGSQRFQFWVSLSCVFNFIERPLSMMWIPEDRSSGDAVKGRVQADVACA